MQLGQKEKAVLIRHDDLNRNSYLFIQLLLGAYWVQGSGVQRWQAGRKKLHVNEAMLCASHFHLLSRLIITHTPERKAVSVSKRWNQGSKSTPKSVDPGSGKVRIQTLMFWFQDAQHPLSREPMVPTSTSRKGCQEVRGPLQWKMRESRAPSIHFTLKKIFIYSAAVGS